MQSRPNPRVPSSIQKPKEKVEEKNEKHNAPIKKSVLCLVGLTSFKKKGPTKNAHSNIISPPFTLSTIHLNYLPSCISLIFIMKLFGYNMASSGLGTPLPGSRQRSKTLLIICPNRASSIKTALPMPSGFR